MLLCSPPALTLCGSVQAPPTRASPVGAVVPDSPACPLNSRLLLAQPLACMCCSAWLPQRRRSCVSRRPASRTYERTWSFGVPAAGSARQGQDHQRTCLWLIVLTSFARFPVACWHDELLGLAQPGGRSIFLARIQPRRLQRSHRSPLRSSVRCSLRWWCVLPPDPCGSPCSCVGVWQNDRVEIIANDQGNRTTPSYVGFTDTERMIGDAAKNQVAMNPVNTVRCLLRCCIGIRLSRLERTRRFGRRQAHLAGNVLGPVRVPL